MMKKVFIVIISLLIIATISCRKENNSCLKATGKRSSETRSLPTRISSIKLEDNINLFIRQDSVNQITIEAGENLIDFIETRYEDAGLLITNNNKCGFLRSYKKDINVYLSINSFDSLESTGSGDITISEVFSADYLRFILSESTGDIDLNVDCKSTLRIDAHQAVSKVKARGNVRYSILYNSGNGWFDMPDLKSHFLLVNSKSTGDIIVGESNTMYVLLQSSGNIRYHGQPSSIELWDTSGDGRLIQE